MLIVSDVHGAFDALAEIARSGETVLVLGDMLNLLDYRTGEGITAEILGRDVAIEIARARAVGDFDRMRAIWTERVDDWEAFRAAWSDHATAQYREMADALRGTRGFTTFGNVDRPQMLREHLPDGWTFVHAEEIEVEGWRIGIVGGGTETRMRAQGEVTDEEMTEALARLHEVDVLCSHVPPAVRPMRLDVVTGREERASQPILDWIREHQPERHFYGDVHQPQAARWRLGRTLCTNVGYFRATHRAVRFEARSGSRTAG